MTAIIQRPLRGSRISTFYPVKNLPLLASLDSAFQLQEYISLLIRLDVHDVNAIVSLPGNPSAKEKEKAVMVDDKKGKEGGGGEDVVDNKGKSETTVDEACWIYEQLRRLAQDLSHPLITTLQQECTRASCPEMKAGEWLYLCVAHGNDGAMEHCCAIDYILHTVDSATALLNSPRTFPSRLQIPFASQRHFSSLARRLGRIFAHAYFHHREAFEQAEAESSLYARFLALTDRFNLVPAEFLVIPTEGHHVGGAGDPLGLGPPPSRSPRDERRPNEFDRGYHQQQQQRTRYDLDLTSFHHGSDPSIQHQLHPNISEWNSSPPGRSESGSGGIGESPSPSSSSRARFGRNRTGTMVFAEAEANAVTDELAARSSLREREREPQKIELLERDGEPTPLKTSIPTASHNEGGEEETQFEISLGSEELIGNNGEGENDVVAPEVFEESPMTKHEFPSLLDLNLESEVAENTAEIAVPPADPEANVSAESLSHSSTVSSKPVEEEVAVASTSDIIADQPKEEPEEPTALVKPAEIEPDDSLEAQPIPTETMTDIPPADENVSIPEPTSIPKETPETATTLISNEEGATKPDPSDDKETIAPSDINDNEESITTGSSIPAAVDAVPVAVDAVTVKTPSVAVVEPQVETTTEPEISEASVDEVSADKAQPEAAMDADVEHLDNVEKEQGEEKASVVAESPDVETK